MPTNGKIVSSRSPKKKINLIFMIAILVLIPAIVIFSYLIMKDSLWKKVNKVCINSNCYEVELARTEKETQIGLMNRSSLAQNKGMLFIFEEEGIYSFWMKNTLIPLDIVWIDDNTEIVDMKSNNRSCTQEPCPLIQTNKKSRYILEINAGQIDEKGLEIGDFVDISMVE